MRMLICAGAEHGPSVDSCSQRAPWQDQLQTPTTGLCHNCKAHCETDSLWAASMASREQLNLSKPRNPPFIGL